MDTNPPTAKFRSLSLGLLLPAIFAAFFLVWRFHSLALAPFSRDEPNLQNLLDHAIADGRVPLLGLVGTYGLRYGPTGMWFYLPLRLFTSDTRAILAWHALSYLVAFALFFRSLRRESGLAAAIWALAFAATSPLLFLYSRLAWDNTLLVPITALLFFALEGIIAKRTFPRAAALGLISGLALGTHPIAFPTVAAALLTAWLSTPADGSTDRLRAFGCTAGAALACLAPYFVALYHWHGVEAGSVISAPSGALAHVIPGILLGPAQFLAPEAVSYFFDGSYPALLFSMPAALAWAGGFAVTIALTLLGWLAVAYGIRLPNSPLRRFALFSLAGTALFFMILRPEPMQPHYFMPLWWPMIYFLSKLLGGVSGARGRLLRTLATLLILVNAAFLGCSLRFLAQNAGTREAHYGSAVGEIEAATRAVCSRIAPEGALLDLSQVPGVSPPSVAYLARHLSECGGRGLYIIPQESPLQRNLPKFRFVYGPGASLRVE